MFDQQLRQAVDPVMNRVAGQLVRWPITADALTGLGLVIGLGSAAAAATGQWSAALVLWLSSRLVDGLDGAVARLQTPSARGGFLDLMADFTVYALFVGAVAWNQPDARPAAIILLITYYLSAGAFLLWSSLAQESARPADNLALADNRTVKFVGGLAEGFETIVCYSLVCLFPDHASSIFFVFAAMVAFTVGQRVVFALRHLS